MRGLALLLGAALACALSCVGPAPVPCTDCGGVCADLQGDARNCGSCGNTCTDGQVCREGSCHANCPGTQTSCAGLCVDTQTDARNCGNCGSPCAAGQACVNGTCLASCLAPLSFCNQVCVDQTIDPNNCGGCGVQCTPQNAVAPVCIASHCAYSRCSDGFADCDGTAVNGCEADVEFDLYNCGGCGVLCLPANVYQPLPDGGFPDAGTTDGGACGELPDGGDAGACPPLMPKPPPGAVCSLGVCGYRACAPGYGDCDGVTSNGCESSLLTDSKHCGRCGIQCATGQSCQSGFCQ